MDEKYEDFIVHFLGFFCMIFFWIVMYKICDKLKYFSEDDLFFNSKTLSFYCLCVPIAIVYCIALVIEFLEF